MGSFSEDEDYRFFDAQEDVASIVDANFDGDDGEGLSVGFDYDLWIRSPRSVRERRGQFMNRMGLGIDGIVLENSLDVCSVEQEELMDRVRDYSGAVTRTCGFEEEYSSTRLSMPMSCLPRPSVSSSKEFCLVENLSCQYRDFDKGVRGNVNKAGEHHGKVSDGKDLGSDQLLAAKKTDDCGNGDAVGRRVNRMGRGWLRRLKSMTCMIDRQREDENGRADGRCAIPGYRLQKVKARHCKKKMKELSALYLKQDIQAHEGSILTMKFSPDGQYLGTGGEDGVVRLWQVVEEDRCNESHIPEFDTCCNYFSVNDLSQLTPLFVDKEKFSKMKSMKKTLDSARVIFPPKIFRLLEKPLREFRGHKSEVLDLSWSKNNYLLSSSADKTVRLWQVNHEQCLKVFPHSNYVTCVQFNPVDDNYFISGSIDGKVRIWATPNCRVIDWTDARDIVTGVCYQPDGQGGIVGSLTGNCRFYNISGLNAGSPMCASFTSDGKHILSACDDSNVYLWNTSQEESNPMKAKKIRSCERFFSNASVAVPWHGLKSQITEDEHQSNVLDKKSPQVIHCNQPASFSLDQELFLESFPKGSATCPEEKLLVSSSKAKTPMMHKSEFKLLKSYCKSTTRAHAWGMVIVTAGWDGRIKSFHNYGLPVPI